MANGGHLENKLSGADAVDLWLKGKDEWNRWVELNPNVDISFSHVNFTEHIEKEDKFIDFKGYHFPKNGSVFFDYASFGDDGVSFNNARFYGDLVSFNFATFGKGRAVFSNAKFLCKNVSFFCANFEGIAIFLDVAFEGEKVFFNLTKFREHVDFSGLDFDVSIKSINFRFACFYSSIEISSKNKMPCIPDFTGTKTSNHFNMSGLEYTLKIGGVGVWSKALQKDDSDYLCRLKEISESNKDHSMALKLHADEMRAKRWHKYSAGESYLDYLFDFTSKYGQSILRPFIGWLLTFMLLLIYTVGYSVPGYVWLVGITLISVFLKRKLVNQKYTLTIVVSLLIMYGGLFNLELRDWADRTTNISGGVWLSGAALSLSKTLPFIAGANDLGKEAQERNRCEKRSDECVKIKFTEHYRLICAVFFTLPSLGFLFLIGLGLRNRFRL